MRTASILLALVVVLGFVREARAFEAIWPTHDYTYSIGGEQFGFQDWETPSGIYKGFEPQIVLGPLGEHEVPFTATQGLIGFCCILAMLVILPVVLTVRWKKKRAAA